MNNYFTMDEVLELEVFFRGVDLSKLGPVDLTPWERIETPESFVWIHIAYCKRNVGNKTFIPYLRRLRAFKKVYVDSHIIN